MCVSILGHLTLCSDEVHKIPRQHQFVVEIGREEESWIVRRDSQSSEAGIVQCWRLGMASAEWRIDEGWVCAVTLMGGRHH